MRKRSYYTLIFILIIILGMIPLVDGILFKKNFMHMIDVINQDDRIKINIVEYNQGWLTSHTKIRITIIDKNLRYLQQLNVPGLNPSLMNFILEGNIQHGPIIYDRNKFNFQFGYAYLRNGLLIDHNKSEIIQIDALSGFNDNWRGQFYMSKFSFSLPTINKITVEELNGSFEITLDNNNIQHIATDMQTGPVSVVGNPLIKELKIQPIKSSYDATRETNNLWSGRASIFSPGITVSMADNSNFIIEKFAVNNTFSFDESILYNTNLTLFIKKITSPSYTIPAFAKLQIILSANNLNAQGINEYINFMKSKTLEELKNIDLTKIENLLAHTIKPTSTLKGSVAADTSLGSFSSRFKAIWPENTPLPNSLNEIITHSYTKIKIKLSNLLVVKLLAIYGDQIITPSDVPMENVKHEIPLNKYFQNQRPSNDNEFRSMVKDLLNQDKITIPLFLQILDLEKQNQSMTIFSLNIDQLDLPPNISQQLKSIYQLQIKNKPNIIINNKTNQQIRDLILIGYLQKTENEDEYVSKLVVEGGILKINGNPFLTTKPTTDNSSSQQAQDKQAP